MFVALAAAAWGAAQIGGRDGVDDSLGNDSSGPGVWPNVHRLFDDAGVDSAGTALDATPTPAPTPASGPTDGPEPSPPEPRPAADQAPPDTVAAAEPERAAVVPESVPPGGAVEAGALVDGVALTYYTCVGDSTGRYCGTMASGQAVHRGAAACGYAWELGTRFRILGDPYEMVYTCLDRGAGNWLWVDVWFHDVTEGRAWRDHLPQYVTVEMMQ